MGDMSPLCKCTISGPDATRLVDQLVPRNIDNLDVGTVQYTPWCNDHGKVVSDGLVFRASDSSYRFTGDRVLPELEHLIGGDDDGRPDEPWLAPRRRPEVTTDYVTRSHQRHRPPTHQARPCVVGIEWPGACLLIGHR